MKNTLFTSFVAASRQSAAFLKAKVGGALPRRRYAALLTLLLLSTLFYQPSTLHAQGTAFTYQGRLNSSGNPASGTYDLTFALFSVSSGAGQVGVTLTNTPVAVSNGLFTVTLDFGANFPGASRWLEIGVRTNGGGAFTTLVPRQALTATPFAITAGTAGTAGSLAIPPGMALIPAGAFTMGNSIGDGDINDAVPTNVTVAAFYMDLKEVSMSQWQSVYYWATNHGYGFVHAGAGKAASHPVHTVDWYDCVKWCNARSQQAGRTPVYYTDAGLTQVYTNGEVTVYPNWVVSGYRLPMEAEWEKAARGGLSGQRFPWGNVIHQNLANYYGNMSTYAYDLGPNFYNPIGSIGGTSPATSPAGSFAANGHGLLDMAGNVHEWCWDWYAVPYGQPTTTNPTGPAGPLTIRVLRGGSWYFSANEARCANRNSDFPTSTSNYLGFRCARGL